MSQRQFRRPRALCPACNRSIAVTFDQRTGDAFWRSHNVRPGQRCPGSKQVAPRVDVVETPSPGARRTTEERGKSGGSHTSAP